MNKYTKNENEIRDFIKPVSTHRKAFLFFLSLFVFLTVVYLYFSEKVYVSEAKIEIVSTPSVKEEGVSVNEEQKINIDTEIDKIQSRKVVSQALEKLGEDVRYYKKVFLKEVEVYKDAPFKVKVLSVKSPEIYSFKFELTPVSSDSFQLKTEESLLEKIKGKKGFYVNGKFRYNQPIDLKFATVEIEKTKDFSGTYTFELVNKEDLIDQALGNLDVNKTSKYSTVLEITYRDNIPLRAKEFIDNLILVYVEDSAKGRTKEIKQKLKFINSQLKIVSKNLKNSEVNLETFKKRNNIIDISSEAKVTIQKLSEFDKEYAKLRIEKKILDFVYNQLLSQNDKTINLYGIKDPVLVSLVEEYNRLLTKKKALLVDYTEYHPDVEKVNAEIERVKKGILKSVSNLKSEIEERLAGTKAVISRYESFLRGLPEKEKEYIRIKRNYAINEKIYSYLVQKKLETSLAEISALAGVRIIDEASLPKVPVKPKTNFILLLGVLMGFMFGTAYGYVRDMFEDKLKYIDEVERLISVPVVGIIPHLKKKEIEEAIDLTKAKDAKVLKIFRIIRANLQLLFRNHKRPQVITITSSENDEGKTTVSANLGIAFELVTDEKIVIVDLNFRNPKIHKFFKLSNESGIFDVLNKDIDKSLERLIERNVLEKNITTAVESILEKEEKQSKDFAYISDIKGIKDILIKQISKRFKKLEDANLEEIEKAVKEEVREILYEVEITNADKLIRKIESAIDKSVRYFSKEKVILVEKEKIYKNLIKNSIKKVPSHENLYVITAGLVEKENVLFSEKLVLSSKKLRDVIKELKKEFKYIIITAPPAFSVPEVFMLMEESDISLAVLRMEKTRKSFVYEFGKKVSDLGLKNVGVVVNDVKEKILNGSLG